MYFIILDYDLEQKGTRENKAIVSKRKKKCGLNGQVWR